MKNVFCADIGTTSLKTAVIDDQGNVLAYSRKSFPATEPNMEATVWLETMKSCMDQIFEEKPQLTIDGICISGNGPTLVGEKGETLLWNAPLPAGAVRSFLSGSLFVPRLYGFSKLFPESWNDKSLVFSGPEYLIYLLTEKPLTILPEERYLPAYWTQESLVEAELAGCESKLPAFVAPSTLAGKLTSKIAGYISRQSNGVTEELPVYCGAPDFVAALVGTNTLAPGKLCDRAGSSEGLNLCTAEKISSPGIRTLPSIIPGLWNASVLLPETGISFSKFKKRLEEYEKRELSYEEAVHLAITSDGLEAIYDQGKYMMLQIAMQIRDGLGVLRNAVAGTETVFPDEFTVAGGQAGNKEWLKMKCDVTGMKAVVPECHDAELIGDAVFAFVGSGTYSSIQEAAEKLCQFKGLAAMPNGDDLFQFS